MCRIGITLSNLTTPEGTTISSATGGYRLSGTLDNFISFNVELSNPRTPDITISGTYDLQVNVTNNVGTVSDWATSTFQISTKCGGVVDDTLCHFDGVYYHYALSPCDAQYPLMFVKSNSQKLIDGTIYQPTGSGNIDKQGALAYKDCEKKGITTIGGITDCGGDIIDNSDCVSYSILNDGEPNGGSYTFVNCDPAQFDDTGILGFGDSIEVCALVPPTIAPGLSLTLLGPCNTQP